MIRLSWPVILLLSGFLVLLARKPRVVFSRAFFPVLLVVGIFVLISYVRRPKPPGAPR